MKTFIRHDYLTTEDDQQVESIIRTNDGKIIHTKGITHMMVVENEKVYYANAICSATHTIEQKVGKSGKPYNKIKADNFSKSRGREIAKNRIDKLIMALAPTMLLGESTTDVKSMLRLKTLFHKLCNASYKTLTYLPNSNYKG